MKSDKLIRSLIREMCKKPEYWGRGGAGIMFRCPEDDTVLLLLRADWVDQGGTWGIPGGGVEEGWFETPIEDPISDPSIFQNAAFREAVEECGSLPPGFSSSQVTGKTVYEDCGFQYVTLIADITLAQKEGWELVSNDGETDDFQWIPMSKLRSGASVMGRRLHFGVEYTLSRM
jgi:8-oxo-dGTP pyrophosphatase MutT (NUDIX family)